MSKYSNSPTIEVLEKAKLGNNEAKLFIINKYIKLILKYSNSYHLKNFEVDDLIQIGNMVILQVINKYDLSKGSTSFDSYMINSIKNAYGDLARYHIKYSDESSLNILTSIDNSTHEIIDLVEDDTNILNETIHKSSISLLNKALNTLPEFEKTLIKEVYLTEKGSLLKYCKTNNLPYGPTRRKLKSILKSLNEFIG